MPDTAISPDDPLAALRARFLCRTHERLALLRATLEAGAATDAAATRDALRRQAHQLAGSAGTFGFAALARAAATLEAEAEADGQPVPRLRALLEVVEERLQDLAVPQPGAAPLAREGPVARA